MDATAVIQASSPLDEAAFHEIALLALKRWDLRPLHVGLIKMRENAVFRVDSEQGGRAVLRIHRQHYHSDAALRSESEWMAALAEAGVRVPRVIRSANGRPFELVAGHQVDMLEWVDGQQLGSVEAGVSGENAEVARKYRIVGEVMARMHQQASQWQPEAGFVRHSWCADGLAGEQPLWGRFWELEALTPAQRLLFEKAQQALKQDLGALDKSPASYGLIHADLVPENLLVEQGDVRVIDFDDAGHGWHMFDIATSLYFLKNEPYFELAKDALVEGYRQHRPLSADALARLPLFLAARSTTYLGWVHERKNTPTALELTPFLVELACGAVNDYLAGRQAKDSR